MTSVTAGTWDETQSLPHEGKQAALDGCTEPGSLLWSPRLTTASRLMENGKSCGSYSLLLGDFKDKTTNPKQAQLLSPVTHRIIC